MTANPGNAGILVTGSSGFIGRHFLAALRQAGISNVTALSRRPAPPPPTGVSQDPPGWRYLKADLEDVASYSPSLRGVATVVHLAAATGSASASDLHRINVDLTARLLEAAQRESVGQILYVSSIAAKYRELGDYPYGQSKRKAEEVVRASRLEFTILRPTIVLGDESPIWHRLQRLATLPAIVVIGDGSTLVQPVDVGDVARALVRIIETRRYSSEVLELGGPEVVSFADLMRRIRKASGRGSAPLLRVPASPLRGALQLGERVLGSRLPISAGQLTPFLEDGVADPNDLAAELRPTQQSLDQLLGRLVTHG